MLDSQATMKVLYDECPTKFQFGIKQARLMTQAVLLMSSGSYSSYVSTTM